MKEWRRRIEDHIGHKELEFPFHPETLHVSPYGTQQMHLHVKGWIGRLHL